MAPRQYLSLDSRKITATVETLERRIGERFPDSGLRKVAAELVGVARDTAARCAEIQRPNRALQGGVTLLAVLLVTVVALLLVDLKLRPADLSLSDLIQDIDSILGSTVFVGASVIFLLTLEGRMKRRRVLKAIHELRSLAHIVDMHQLTKDPELLAGPDQSTPSSPQRTMSPFELERYLDYSSEMLSLLSKIAALYMQESQDPVVLSAVDDLEGLTNGLSRKIWQKIMIVDRIARPHP